MKRKGKKKQRRRIAWQWPFKNKELDSHLLCKRRPTTIKNRNRVAQRHPAESNSIETKTGVDGSSFILSS